MCLISFINPIYLKRFNLLYTNNYKLIKPFKYNVQSHTIIHSKKRIHAETVLNTAWHLYWFIGCCIMRILVALFDLFNQNVKVSIILILIACLKPKLLRTLRWFFACFSQNLGLPRKLGLSVGFKFRSTAIFIDQIINLNFP
jgi:hypothetical protein